MSSLCITGIKARDADGRSSSCLLEYFLLRKYPTDWQQRFTDSKIRVVQNFPVPQVTDLGTQVQVEMAWRCRYPLILKTNNSVGRESTISLRKPNLLVFPSVSELLYRGLGTVESQVQYHVMLHPMRGKGYLSFELSQLSNFLWNLTSGRWPRIKGVRSPQVEFAALCLISD